MGEETIALNRKARHEFHVEETFEAGIVLTGTEIKSIRAGKANIANAYARIEKGDGRGAEQLARAHYAGDEPGWGESVDTAAVVSADLLEGR